MTELFDPYEDYASDWGYDHDYAQYGDPKEEPACPPCGDSGYIGRRNCAGCNPTRLQHLWWRLTWRFRWWRIRAWFKRGNFDTEAPF